MTVAKFEEFAHVRIDACRSCGRPLAFSSQFKKFGEHRVEVCEHCALIWHNDDKPEPVTVAL